MESFPPFLTARFKPLASLGCGNFGCVWRAVDLRDGSEVAIKVLNPAAAADEELLARFSQEAEILAQLRHPGVIGYVSHSIDVPAPYLVLRYAAGRSLRARLSRGPMPLGQALLIAIRLAAALAELHRHRFLHRDFKPENICLLGQDTPVLMDFGMSTQPGSAVHTRRGIILGTPAYLAPEQLSDEAAGPAADQYSLGIVLYEMLAGRRPFEGATPADEALARLQVPARPLLQDVPGLDPESASIVMRMLERQPHERFEDLERVRSALQLAAQRLFGAEAGTGNHASGAGRHASPRQPVRTANRRQSSHRDALVACDRAPFGGAMATVRRQASRARVALATRRARIRTSLAATAGDRPRLRWVAISVVSVGLLWMLLVR